jgi:hypothetical protein
LATSFLLARGVTFFLALAAIRPRRGAALLFAVETFFVVLLFVAFFLVRSTRLRSEAVFLIRGMQSLPLVQ